jgi:hypothetical protein
VIDVLERVGVTHMVAGSFASNFHGVQPLPCRAHVGNMRRAPLRGLGQRTRPLNY